MSGMRQRLKKWQWFALFNVAVVVAACVTGRLQFTVQGVVSLILVLGLMNVLSLISAAKFKDWKK